MCSFLVFFYPSTIAPDQNLNYIPAKAEMGEMVAAMYVSGGLEVETLQEIQSTSLASLKPIQLQ